METNDSYGFLTGLLERERPTPADIDALIAAVAKEDQYLDYKSGREQTRGELSLTLRRWITGFWNADGGTLILGISERGKEGEEPRRVVGLDVSGVGDGEEWATRVLQRYAGRYSLPPRIVPVDHPDGRVLVVAVARAEQLIPYANEQNDPKFAFRIGDSTVDAKSWLISDLLLGRRNRPVLKPRNVRIDDNNVTAENVFPLRVLLEVENLSFIKAGDTRMGTIAWSIEDEAVELSSQLLENLDARRPQMPHLMHQHLRVRHERVTNSPATIGPFDVFNGGALVAKVPLSVSQGKLSFALYLAADGGLPSWHEINLTYRLRAVQPPSGFAAEKIGEVEVSDPIVTRRPVVSWSQR